MLRTTQAQKTADLIDFGIGQPGMDLLPLEIMRQASAVRLSQGEKGLLNYGYEPGDGYFCEALARFLGAGYGSTVTADSLFITNGASQALDLICTRFTHPGDTIFVEEPSYFLALNIFADYHLNIISIPIDKDGLRLDALAQALQHYQPVFLYVIPTFQNPTGVTMPAANRQQLVAMSEQHGFYIVADEVYQLLHYTAVPPLPFAHWAGNGRIISVGSFSKILAPGLRLGWTQAAPDLIARLVQSGLVDSGGGLNPFTSNLVRVVLEEGWQDSFLAQLKVTYQERVAAMDAALATHLGDRVQYERPSGGFFFWLEMTDGWDTALLLPESRKQGVGYQPGIKFSSQDGLHHFMRLSFAFYDAAEIEVGIGRLGELLSKHSFST
jgi:DNA-binding transcriptional MocR family regulator